MIPHNQATFPLEVFTTEDFNQIQSSAPSESVSTPVGTPPNIYIPKAYVVCHHHLPANTTLPWLLAHSELSLLSLVPTHRELSLLHFPSNDTAKK